MPFGKRISVRNQSRNFTFLCTGRLLPRRSVSSMPNFISFRNYGASRLLQWIAKMTACFYRVVSALALATALSVSLYAQKSVRYEVRFSNAVHHEAEVRATFSGVQTTSLEVVMSRSSPGRYAIHEFAKNVYNVRAMDESGHPLDISRPNPYAWIVTTAGN